MIKLKTKKLDVFWLLLIFFTTVPFIYVEAGVTTAVMIFIVYSVQMFNFWATHELQNDIKTLFENDINLFKISNHLLNKQNKEK